MKNMDRRTIILIAAGALALVLAVVWWSGHHRAQRYVIAKKEALGRKGIAKKARGPALPLARKKAPGVKVAIVMDDLGNNVNLLDEIFAIKEPITFSVLPNLKYSEQTANDCRAHGYEVILHLPLEPHRKDVKEEFDTIKSGMSAAEVTSMLDQEIGSVPGLKGVSNHMGSKSTEENPLMRVILSDLKKKKLYFFDSLTSERSVCGGVARSIGERYAKRDIFLDNTDTVDNIEKQLAELEKLAFRKERAVAVCHYRKNTVTALGRMLPAMARDGIEFVYLSEMVN